MIDALRFEWVRIRTVRATYWLIAAALALNVAVAFLVAYVTRDDPLDPELVGAVATGGGPLSPVPFAAVFLAVIGIFATGHEYRYGTVQPTLTTVPQRSTLLTAKLLVLGVTAVVVTAVSLLVNVLVALLVWGEVPGVMSQALPGYLVLVLLWTMLGAALAQLFRGVPSALVVILAVPLIVEQLVISLSFVPALDWLAPAIKFLPFTAGQQLVALRESTEVEFLARWASGGVFAVFVAAVLAVAWTLFTRRDA
jgi:ABC-2 type transport system permease protein